ncbi:MAG: hypothetical protein CUN52_00755 [Phototrophicales bacterium]|nr:MAG: hypothetical protein CUN52_00755 [Phototrophicales bacterium]
MKIVLLVLMISLLAGCGGGEGSPTTSDSTEAVTTESGAVQVVLRHLTLLVNKDEMGFAQTLCPAYEGDGMREFRSFGAVEASLNDVSCAEDGTNGDVVLVLCTGTIDLVYQGEDTRGLDLSRVPYRVINDDGEWKVCGKGREMANPTS